MLYTLVDDMRFENPPRKDALLSSLIINIEWEVPISHSFSLVDIYRSIPSISTYHSLDED